MVNYGKFVFSSATRTASTFFTFAAHTVGLASVPVFPVHDVRILHSCITDPPDNVPRVTIVRHPCDWLASFYDRVHPYCLGIRSDLLCEFKKTKCFSDFVEWTLANHAGIVGKMFDDYKAEIVLKTECINGDFVKLLVMLGLPCSAEHEATVRSLKPYNVGLGIHATTWDSELRQRFIDSESDCMSKYGFAP